MPARSRDERVLIARIAAARRWGKTTDNVNATQPARQGLQAKFEREADPDGKLSPAERSMRAKHLMRAHMLSMSLKAKQARRKVREHQAEADAAESELRRLGTDPLVNGRDRPRSATDGPSGVRHVSAEPVCGATAPAADATHRAHAEAAASHAARRP